MVPRLDRKRFKRVKKLMKHNWLSEKEVALNSLFLESDNEVDHDLLVNLLERFYYVNNDQLGQGLARMAQMIVSEVGFPETTTQIAAITYDDEADSSQKFLDHVKIPVAKAGWVDVKTVNSYRGIMKNHKKGKTNIILVDEFLGSGKTLRGRVKQLKNDIDGPFELKVVYFCGMSYAVEALLAEGVDVRCATVLERGITDQFSPGEVFHKREAMKRMESNLRPEINGHKLSTYSLGYNEAESLYSLEGCHGNTPNSVFPLFWWPISVSGQKRERLVVRYERGLA